jgi:chorismate synthase
MKRDWMRMGGSESKGRRMTTIVRRLVRNVECARSPVSEEVNRRREGGRRLSGRADE